VNAPLNSIQSLLTKSCISLWILSI